MDPFFYKKALKYIKDHRSFEDVTEEEQNESEGDLIVKAAAIVNLPAKFIKAGITDKGVKSREAVFFAFPKAFPLKAPIIKLRENFPKCFPHINASEDGVLPCIYEGNLSELLQQSEWMNGILNQLVDWLEKAASNDLMNYDQGWEPMRNDRNFGFLEYDGDTVLRQLAQSNRSFWESLVSYDKIGENLFAILHPEKKDGRVAHAVFFLAPDVVNTYVPNTVNTVQGLCEFARSIGIEKFKTTIAQVDSSNINENVLFVVLLVKRPVNLIGSTSDVEFLNFVIKKSPHRKKKKRELNRIMPDCVVGMVHHLMQESPELLRRLSGSKASEVLKDITLIGCGSLGSKIGMHLARNGNAHFRCIDNGVFMPHNNARHALTFAFRQRKAYLLALAMQSIGIKDSKTFDIDVLDADCSDSRLIIDTTASFVVRNYLMDMTRWPPVISCGLYEKGQFGLMLIESEDKSTRLIHAWAFLYFLSSENKHANKMLFSQNVNDISIGQACSSQTMVASDSQISLVAAAMSIRIQKILESGFSENAAIVMTHYDGHGSLISSNFDVPKFIQVDNGDQKEWDVFISEALFEKMKKIMLQKKPNETGGVLLGSVFINQKAIVITGIVDAPPDSSESPALFELGIEGLDRQIRSVEEKTNGKVTYLGTWHSHPEGGGPSPTDEQTFKKLLFVRDYEPTVCLIVTEKRLIMV